MTTNSISKLTAGFFAAVLTVATLTPASQAQALERVSKVNVPFAFEVGSAHFAPGQYDLAAPREHVLTIHGAANSALAMTSHDINLKPSQTGKVVFHKIGDKYFLAEVWSPSSQEHLTCYQSSAEQKAAKLQRTSQIASGSATATTEIALLQITK